MRQPSVKPKPDLMALGRRLTRIGEAEPALPFGVGSTLREAFGAAATPNVKSPRSRVCNLGLPWSRLRESNP
jgi:hypothetical protein